MVAVGGGSATVVAGDRGRAAPCCGRASRRGEIKIETIIMTNMNVLMPNLAILDFLSKSDRTTSINIVVDPIR